MSDLPPPLLTVQEPPAPWGFADVFVFLGLTLALVIVSSGAAEVALRVVGVTPKGFGLLVGQFIGYALALVPLHLLFVKKFGESPFRLLRLSVGPGQARRSIALGVLTTFAVIAAAALLRTPRIDTPMEELLADPVMLATATVLGVTLGPWFEELIFRGLLQPVMVRHLGAAAGIVLSSLPFALLHGPQYGWSWRHVVLITLAGCAFGAMRHRTQSTGNAALMHCAYNGVLFAGVIVAKLAGTEIPQAI